MANTALESWLVTMAGGAAGQVLRPGEDGPEWSGLDALKASPGYVVLPGGLIIQWGQAEIGASTGATVSLAVEFPTAGLACYATHGGTVSVHADPLGCTFDGSTTTLLITNAYSGGVTAAWLAIGY